jgi:lipopolysaccharide/colanic/teichoic acid biosynthesis glycosyltransferase
MDIAAESIAPRSQTLRRRLSRRIDAAVKRLIDVLLSFLGLLLFSPFFLLIAFAIRRDSPGPVFYRGPRLGRAGRVFEILKFRTMYETEQSYQGPRVTAEDDARVTPVGRWLRQTKLNELPQLWNILIGEMSCVGPRPEDPQLAAAWPEEARQEVLSVRPGLTSPATVLYRDEDRQLKGQPLMETYLDAILPSKLRLDQLYVRNHSIWLDLDILFWTALVLAPRLGSYKPPEGALYAGFFSRLLRRLLSWYVVDALITLLALSVTGLIWRSFAPLDVGWLNSIVLALGFAFLFSLCGALLGTHRVSWSKAVGRELFNLLAAAGLATGLALLANHFIPNPSYGQGPLYPPAMLLTAAGLSFVGFVLVRFRGQLFAEASRGWLIRRKGTRAAQERVMIVGSGESGEFAAWLLSNSRSAGVFNVVGFIDDDLYKQGMRIAGVRVLGRREEIARLVRELDIGILVFAIHNIASGERQRLLEICTATSARVVMIPDILGALNRAITRETRLDDPPVTPLWEKDAFGPLPQRAVPLKEADFAELERLAQSEDFPALQQRLAELRRTRL